MSLNVRGIANDQKRRAIFDKHRENADILILVETHSSTKIENLWENEWGGKIYYSNGTTAARGVMVLVRKNLPFTIQNVETEDTGRLVILDIIGAKEISLAAIYAPNEDSPSFFENLEQKLKYRKENRIIIGDFNLTLDVERDRQNTYCNNNKAKETIENMMDHFFLKDIWRIQNEDKKEFSWIKKGSYPSKASRIDFALVSGGLDQSIETTQYISSIMTDHRAIYLVIQLHCAERGRGYWKLNTSLLQKQEYIEYMNLELQTTINSSTGKTPQQKWELLKKRIKEKTIDFSKTHVAEEKLVIAQLSEKLNEYEERLPLTKEEDQLMEMTRMELEEKSLERAKGVMFRSKAKWYEEGEKNTKYFYQLEKAKYNAKTCFKIISEDNIELEDPQQILEVQKSFYKNLYQEDEDVHFALANRYGVLVPEEVRENQEQQLTMIDLEQAIKTMKNNKTPGQDGIPVDFYKVFWSMLKGSFYSMVLATFQDQILHNTARQGILNLIPKANKDTRYVKNLRPITLLNTDYKIIEKAIANKMVPALQSIIHKDQRGFMKERRISVNIRKMLDIIHQVEQEDLEAVVLSLDFVKCFDKCSFSILHGSLDFFNFGSIVREWTQILYKDFQVRIQNNGHFSSPIPIEKGVHQGGCCSSIYFLVIAEILALSLRSNERIEGIELRMIRNLLNQFADDMDIFTMCTKQSLQAIHHELEEFRKQSGFTVSYDKTTLYRIGSLRHSDAAMYDMNQFSWSNKDINVLGITIAHEDLVHKNYAGIANKSKNILNSWQNRGLSLIGKVQVVNTLVASQFVYKMMVLPQIPKQVVKNMENVIREFLWSGGKS